MKYKKRKERGHEAKFKRVLLKKSKECSRDTGRPEKSF